MTRCSWPGTLNSGTCLEAASGRGKGLNKTQEEEVCHVPQTVNPEAGGPATGLWRHGSRWEETSSYRSLAPRVEMGGDSTTVWLDRPGGRAVQLERTKSGSEFKAGWKSGQGGVRPRAGKGSQVGRNSACLLQTFLSFANGNCSPGLC